MLNLAIGPRQKIGDWLNKRNEIVFDRSFGSSLDMVRTILVVAQVGTPEREDAIVTLKKELKNVCPAAQQKWLSFLANPKKGGQDSYISADDVHYVAEADFSFWFKIKNADLLALLAQTYDIMIVLTEKDDILLDYVVRYVRAGLRVGCAGRRIAEKGTLNFYVAMPDDATLTNVARQMVSNIQMMFKRQ